MSYTSEPVQLLLHLCFSRRPTGSPVPSIREALSSLGRLRCRHARRQSPGVAEGRSARLPVCSMRAAARDGPACGRKAQPPNSSEATASCPSHLQMRSPARQCGIRTAHALRHPSPRSPRSSTIRAHNAALTPRAILPFSPLHRTLAVLSDRQHSGKRIDPKHPARRSRV